MSQSGKKILVPLHGGPLKFVELRALPDLPELQGGSKKEAVDFKRICQ